MVTADPERPAVGTELWSNRPAVIISNNVINARSGFAEVIYLSTATRKRSGPLHVELTNADGSNTMALCEQIHTVDASRLTRKLHTLQTPQIREIEAAISMSLSLGRNPDTHSAFRKWEEHIKLHGIDMSAEIQALAGQTTDQRVEALTQALELMTVERDAYRNLYETSQKLPSAIKDVESTTSGEIAIIPDRQSD